MKKVKNILLILTILISTNIYSQLSCGTPQNSTPQHFPTGNDNSFSVNSAPICINVQFHIVRTTAGTGGATITTLDQVTNLLNNHFNPHNININKVGYDYINNSAFYDMTDAEFNSLVATNNNPNAINFYIINSCSTWIGRAGDITSRNLVMVNSYCNTGVSAHELGHCLNLWHTFQGTASGTSGCAELINGSNCSSCGDYVCDTPADARTGISGGYTPDMTNDMSYYSAFTLDHFSNLQGSRMRDALNGSSVLQPVVGNLCKTIIGSDNICMSPNQTYTVSNSASSNVIWSVTPNIQIVSQNTTTLVIRAFSNSPAVGKITATINGLTISKTIYIGKPQFPITGIVNGASNTIYNQTITYTYNGAYPSGGTSTYQWYINAPMYDNGGPTCAWQILSGQGTNTITVKTGCITTTAVVAVRVSNACGITEKYMYVNISAGSIGSGGNPCIPSLRLYSNPIKDGNLQMRVAYPALPCDPNQKMVNNSVKIYDFYGSIVYENKFDSDELNIKDLNLKSGNYIINVNTENGETLKEIIVVE